MKNSHKHHVIKRLSRRTPFVLRSHHAKPVRKRHVLALGICAALVLVIAANGLSYLYDQYDAQVNASLSSRQEMFAHDAVGQVVTIRSNYGFGLKVDRTIFDITATADQDGQLEKYDSYNVAAERAYTTIELTPRTEAQRTLAATSMLLVGFAEPVSVDAQASHTNALFAQQLGSDKANYTQTLVSETERMVAGTKFMHRTYSFTPKQQTKNLFQPRSISVQMLIGYNTSNRPVMIRLTSPATTLNLAAYDQVLNGLFFNAPATTSTQKAAGLSEVKSGNSAMGLAWLHRSGLVASAEAETPELDRAKIVATNIPAVVKLYHVRCGGIVYRDQAISEDTCSASTGTGFFVSSDGLIATNGHVVAQDIKDELTSNISVSVLARLLRADGFSARDITNITTDYVANSQVQASVAQAIRQLPVGSLKYANQKDFYIVALAKDTPNFDEIIKKRQFSESATIKSAELKALDYDSADLSSKTGFSHSDVAVLKITGSNYPVVRLGDIDGLVQGAGVTVLGYPNDAESNGLVRADSLQTSATEGIVSAIRQVNGNGGKVVQSDVSIGHGNSGGPAFDNSGRVLGIATYLLGGSDGGNGISYLRDVKDLKNLLRANQLNLNTSSEVQRQWEQGLNQFYAAHYRKAIEQFAAVQKAYPGHTLAEQYMTIASQKIANGEEAQSVLLGYALFAALIGGCIMMIYIVVLIVRHRAHHHLYIALQAGYLTGSLVGLFTPPHASEVSTLHRGK